MFIVSCATYDPNTNELNSYVLGKTQTLAKAKEIVTEDIEDYKSHCYEDGETDYYGNAATWKSKNGFTVQYEIYEF